MSKISVIIPFYNAESYIVNAIESVLAQDFTSKDIYLFLIDDGSNDASSYYAKAYEKQHRNIRYFRQENKGVSAARNLGIELALSKKSEFVFFLDADDKYKKNHIKTCVEELKTYSESVFVFGTMRFFEGKNQLRKEYTASFYENTHEIDFFQEDIHPYYVGHVAQGGWRAEIFENHRFNEDLTYSEDIEFICKVLLKNKFVFSKDVEYQYRIRNRQDSVVNEGDKHLQWYERVSEVFKPLYEESILLHERVPLFIQQAVVVNLNSLFNNEENTDVLKHINYAKLENAFLFLMQNTEESIIEQECEHWQKMYFLMKKHGKAHITRWAPLPTFVLNDTGNSDSGKRLGYLGSDDLVLHLLSEKKGILKIYASMRCITYDGFKLNIQSDFQVETTEVATPFSYDKLFFANKEIFPRKYYEIKVALHKSNVKPKGYGFIRFFLKTDYDVPVSIRFEAVPLSNIGFNMPFTLGDEYIIKRTKHNNILEIAPLTERELIDFCTDIRPFGGIGKPSAKAIEKFEELKNSILKNFRTFSNKRIWLFMDRGNEVGNNAEAFFRYCMKQDDGIQKYYIIPDESYAERFVGLPFMIFGTLEYKLLCCFAEKFISSFLFDEGLTLQFGVGKAQKEMYEDIRNFKKLTKSFFRGKIVHLQHGVIMQDISFYLNKFYEDTCMICNVSKKEHEYVTTELSHTEDVGVWKLTGLPTYDYLEQVKRNPKSQKMILFAPSFDRKFTVKGMYNAEYKHSEHFQYVNSILSSETLLDAFEEKGYTLCFKPHYVLLGQLEDFVIDTRVNVIKEAVDRYELYAMSDFMITDYSGIAFDFAYLKKPLVYAHFLKEPKFKETYFSYENNGFGEVCYNITQLTDSILRCMKQEFKISEKYEARIDAFYTFQDGKNCERIYKEIKKIPDTRKNIFQ